ncbi:hypothetical protein BAUCODRAFT_119138 [Baudoinia panamericana UAMH 10762]|uniref:Uncharacterized protein n=1 Tax=Baudoinia panamericana (strain UAMH 10762) TaxID=717646 RepID=M2MRV8_BAUPA|nr:uncharacterized protein BAUCODRAFT_119138 [Baudoinia panamericana UAMH 10762]EMC99561.1 hypothetical protein BAUCODRAFT_119138 [Baudoinia panamericana UAMH 10762]
MHKNVSSCKTLQDAKCLCEIAGPRQRPREPGKEGEEETGEKLIGPAYATSGSY